MLMQQNMMTPRDSLLSNAGTPQLRALNDPMLASQQLMDLTQQIEVMKKQIELQKLQNQMLEMRQSAMIAQSQMPVQQSLRHEIAVGSNDVFIKPRESGTDASDLVNHMNK